MDTDGVPDDFHSDEVGELKARIIDGSCLVSIMMQIVPPKRWNHCKCPHSMSGSRHRVTQAHFLVKILCN